MAHEIDEKRELHGGKTVDRQFAVLGAAAGHRGVFQSQEREFETVRHEENQTVPHAEKEQVSESPGMCAV